MPPHRRIARQFKKDHCEGCFRRNCRLEMHHLDEDIWNNDPDNLVTLCRRCHALIHELGKNRKRDRKGRFDTETVG